DMLSNRADTYNLGDIIGGNAEWFRASYLENALTSNPVLAPLATRSQADVRAFIQAAERGERAVEGLEGSYSAHEAEEILSVLRKLAALRDVVMRVNAEYIASAAQADEFRTEPPFKLQGSYRNMNRLAEKVVALLNEEEVRALVLGHYRSESQTLTTGAEANLLKLLELLGAQSPEEAARWEEIKKTFRRNQYTRGTDSGDPVGRVVAQLALFQSGLESIQATIASHGERPAPPVTLDLTALEKSLEPLRATLAERLARGSGAEAPLDSRTSAGLEAMGAQLRDGLKSLGVDLTRAFREAQDGAVPGKVESLSHEMEMMHSTLATLKDLAAQQRDHLRNAQELLATRARQGTLEVEVTQDMLANERAFLEQLQRVLEGAQRAQ
ncbi:MAG: hypothetical protein KIT22_20365, partial [Verrucomicrobiae bacterium]|nr:hypothetical protein [Verrucomicrobiae bacterium]